MHGEPTKLFSRVIKQRTIESVKSAFYPARTIGISKFFEKFGANSSIT